MRYKVGFIIEILEKVDKDEMMIVSKFVNFLREECCNNINIVFYIIKYYINLCLVLKKVCRKYYLIMCLKCNMFLDIK